MPEEILPSAHNIQKGMQARIDTIKAANAAKINKEVEAPKIEEPVKVEVGNRELSQRERIRQKIDRIIAEHHGILSNIPMNSPYWNLIVQYRRMLK